MRATAAPALGAALALTLAAHAGAAAPRAPGAAAAPGARVRLTNAQMLDLAGAVREPLRADSAIKAIARHLAGNPDSSQVPQLRAWDVRGQVAMQRTYGEIAFAVTNYLAAARGDTVGSVRHLLEFSDLIVERVDCQHLVRQYCNRALNLLTARAGEEPLRSRAWELLGRRELMAGSADSAVALLTRALPASAERQSVLRLLGSAYEKRGERDKAIASYVESAATYLGADSSAAAPLRALWADVNGSLAGLEERLAAAREASHREVFEARRFERDAPDWSLPDLAGRAVNSADLRGKVVALTFWGTWCEPCREELPHFEQLYRDFGGRGVAFVAANWEMPSGTKADRVKRAKDYLAKEKLTFPVVLDDDRQAIDAFDPPGFPTTYVIDARGRIRFRNVGYQRGAEQLVREQIEDALKAR